MEYMIRGGNDFDVLYNCSFYNVTEIPLERRQNIPLGLYGLTFPTVEAILYVPCLWVIWQNAASSSCYKLMFVIGLLDITYLGLAGTSSAWFQLRGYVYCMAPRLMYTISAVGTGIFMARSLIEIILASDRCLYFVAIDLYHQLFPEKGAKVWWWTVPPLLYGLVYMAFGRVFLFAGHMRLWALNPHNGYHDEMEHLYVDWKTNWYVYHNYMLMVALPAVYVVFLVNFLKRSRAIGSAADTQRSSSARPIFIQIAILTSINCVFCYLCAFTSKYFEVMPKALREVILPFVQLFCIQIYGVPPLIYLTLNKTVRGDLKKILKQLFGANNNQVKPTQSMVGPSGIGTTGGTRVGTTGTHAVSCAAPPRRGAETNKS